MPKTIVFILFLFLFTSSFSQPLPDSIISQYKAAATNEAKGSLLFNYVGKVVLKDSKDLDKALEVVAYFNRQNDETGSDYTQLSIASWLGIMGDYGTGLETALPLLAKFEKRSDTFGIVTSLKLISVSYNFSQDHTQAISYMKRRISVAEARHNDAWLADAYNDLAYMYAEASRPDSGIMYAQKAVNINTRMNNTPYLIASLGTLAENYMAQGEHELALPFLKKSLTFDSSMYSPWTTAFAYTDLAEAFLGLKAYDSANHYAHQSISLSDKMGFKYLLLRSYEALSKSFEASGKTDSSNIYFRLATVTKDSIYSVEKTNKIQAINFKEQLHQQQIESEKMKAAEERRNNIQYAAIAIGLILFISVFLLLSRSIIVNEKWISFLGVLGLLILFEFINLFLHPYLDKLTGHSPVLMLGILVIIASLLIPLHHRLEHWVKSKMVEKNKRIRLEAARKTIEQLENDG